MTSQLSNESVVLRQLQQGGEAELVKFFMAHRENLKAMVSARIHGMLKARFDASDIVQETFLRAQWQFAKYIASPDIHPLIWLRVVCRQLLHELARKQLRSKRSPNLEQAQGSSFKLVEHLADSQESITEAVAQREMADRIQSVIAKLDPVAQEIIEMRHAEEMSFVQIAKLLEMNMEAVKKRYYRALDEVRQLCIEQEA